MKSSAEHEANRKTLLPKWCKLGAHQFRPGAAAAPSLHPPPCCSWGGCRRTRPGCWSSATGSWRPSSSGSLSRRWRWSRCAPRLRSCPPSASSSAASPCKTRSETSRSSTPYGNTRWSFSSLATRRPRMLMKKHQMHASHYSVPERLIRGDSRIFSDITFKFCEKLFISVVSS